MKIYIASTLSALDKIKYVFRVFEKHFNISLQFVEEPSQAEFIVDAGVNSNMPVAVEFYEAIQLDRYDHEIHFDKGPFIRTQQGSIDYLATAFYMINSLQEYGSTHLDQFGRFEYKHSYQYKYQVATENYVSRCFHHIHELLFPGKRIIERKSKVFLTHDIDSVHGALLQDSYYLLKKIQPVPILKIILNAILQKPDWLTVDDIMDIEDEHSLKSTFFWLVEKGKVNSLLSNSDYDFDSKLIQSALKRVESRHFTNGLHKSISHHAFPYELDKLGFPVVANRNHYLKMSVPDHYEEIEESKLLLDTTLGFAEHYGFRNSYGLPFKPFNFKTGKAFSFVEAPLQIMDGTFQKYLRLPKKDIPKVIIDFMERNKYNTTFTILWHNSFFSHHKFEGYLNIYKQLLVYLKEAGIEGTTTQEIIKEYNG